MSGDPIDFKEDNYENCLMPELGGRIPIDSNLSKDETDTTFRFTAIGVGIVSLLCENVIGHPFIVARRQCQLHRKAIYYHLTPISLLPIMLKVQRHQGFGTLWKGTGSVCIVRGMAAATEAVISEFTSLPREVSLHSSLKHIVQHLVLKGCSYALLTPFFCASLIETVQSNIASEKPGVLDFLKEGFCRLFHWGTPHSPRFFPIWILMVPTALHSLLRYILSSMVKSTISWILVHYIHQQQTKDEIERGWSSTVNEHLCEVTAGFVGNLVADVVLYPCETVLHRLYLQGTRTIIDNLDTGTSVTPVISTYQGILECFHTIVQEEGASGLYKGFGALMLQYTIHGIILKSTQLCVSKVTDVLQTKNKPRL